jgi:CO/xanthine dehydrogenase FAD-binding subunit
MINPHPGLPEFEYIRPETLQEASQFLASHPNLARPLMGGTDIFVRMRDGVWNDKYLVDVKNLDGMDAISFDHTSGLKIGASVNMNQVINSPNIIKFYPVLAEAASKVASYQLRTRATIVGNICNASPAGDTTGVCMLLGGILNVHGVNGIRQETLEKFFLGPGKTRLQSGDIVTSIQFPLPPPGLAGTYIKLGRNNSSDLAIVGISVIGYPDRHTPAGYRFKLALASVAPVPLVVTGVEEFLAKHPITQEQLIEAGQIAMDACDPIDDVRASARYRKMMVRNLSSRGLKEVWESISKN